MSKAREASDYSNKQTTKNSFFNVNFDIAPYINPWIADAEL